MTTEKLNVFIGDCLVGSITRLPGFQCFFGFDESYISAPDRPTLSQFYLNANGELRIESRPARHKLVPTWFSNLLPEGPLRTYLAQRGDVRPDAEFNLLELLGNDLPGAVRVQAVGDISNSQYELREEARPAQEDGPMRFSLAGVQLKFSGIKNAREGLTIPASGSGGDWIIKLPSSIYPAVPENEAAMLALAAQVGFNVPEHRLVRMTDIEGLPDLGSFAGNQAIAVKRFDRAPDGKRIHIEDLAQVFGLTPNEKYEKVGYARIAEMIATVIGSAAAQDFVARLVFTTLTGNGDMHLKNWSLIYPDGRTPALSPAYDLVSTIPYIPTDRLALNLAGKKAFTDITKAQFASLAQKAKLSERETLLTVEKAVEATVTAWDQSKSHTHMAQDTVKLIDNHIHQAARRLR